MGPEVPPPPNAVRLQSEAGDWIGAGAEYNYTQANSLLTVTAVGGRLEIDIQGDERWSGTFQMPGTATRLETGHYAGLARYPFHDAAIGGLQWTGEGRGCNTLAGSFTIESVTYEGTTLTAIALRFEQFCDGSTSALRGTVEWRSDDSTAPPGPVNPIPAGLWRPAAGSTPTSGSFVYLNSEPGDYIGGGGTYTFTPANAAITVNASGGRVSVTVNSGTHWFGDFQAMNVLSQPTAGYYPDLQRYPFHNPVKGGLNWSGAGRGCNTLNGWFAIDQITIESGSVTRLDLRFEQHCEGGSSALHGVIHWVG